MCEGPTHARDRDNGVIGKCIDAQAERPSELGADGAGGQQEGGDVEVARGAVFEVAVEAGPDEGAGAPWRIDRIVEPDDRADFAELIGQEGGGGRFELVLGPFEAEDESATAGAERDKGTPTGTEGVDRNIAGGDAALREVAAAGEIGRNIKFLGESVAAALGDDRHGAEADESEQGEDGGQTGHER